MQTTVTKRTWIQLIVALLGVLIIVPGGLPRIGLSAQGVPVAGQSGIMAAYAFEEGTGTTVNDASGNGNTGTISGATWTTAGKYGKALSFNGTSSWVTVPDSASLDFTLGLTLEAWVKPTTNTGWRTAIMKETPTGLAYTLYASNGSRPAGHIFTNTEYSIAGTTAASLTAWTHIAATYDGTTLRVYYNGALSSSKAVSGLLTTSTDPLRIGGNAVWGEYFSGLIDDVRLYGRALSATEVQTDMNTAVAPIDSTPPTVSLVSPAGGATSVPASSNVTATFSEAMTPATVSASSFELRNASNQLVPATVTYNGSTYAATLDPTADLASNSTYTATIRGGTIDPRVMDGSGNALASNVVWSFTTASNDTTPPTVSSVSPVSGAGGVAASTDITATFSEAMTAVDGTVFELRNAANQLVSATVTFNAATFTATLDPAANLASGAIYTATVRGGASDPRAKDAAGNALAASSVWSFTVADTTPPTVSSVSPASGATSVAAASNITATFSEAMSAPSIDASSIELRNASNQLVSGTVTYNAASLTATLDPAANLTPGATYTATVRGGATDPRIKDAAGNALAANLTWSFTIVPPVDTTPPVVSSATPASGTTIVNVATNVTATFSEAMTAATIDGTTIELRDASNQIVPATVSYNAATLTATLDPASDLTAGATYTATVRGGATDPRVKDAAGNALAASFTWSFQTTPPASGCPCSIWPPTATPGTPDVNDPSGVEIGVKFKADRDGAIMGVRFYKGAGNTGPHVGSLWTAGGALLGSVTFTNETASGWQQAEFPTHLAITADTVYVVSYHAPGGHYAGDGGFFASGVDNGPVHALANPVSPNGVYKYTAAPTAFPDQSFNASNYWVDVLYVDSTDTVAPVVSSVTPAAGATGIAISTSVTATFNEPLDPSTVNATSVELRTPANALVSATLSYDAVTRTVTLQPSSPLSAPTVYTATVRGGTADPRVKDTSSNALAANKVWSFTTSSQAPVVSGTSPASGATGIAVTGAVTATFDIAINASTVNTSTFELRTPSNVLVPATVSYDSVTRTATLQPSAALGYSTVYTATLRGGGVDPRVMSAGGTALASDKVWSFTTAPAPPVVSNVSPAGGTTGVAVSSAVTATFDIAIDPTTMTTSTFELRTPSNALVAATVSYNAAAQTATLQPSTALSYATVYTATVRGGGTAPRVLSAAGVPLAANMVWSFTTAGPAPVVTGTTPASGAANIAISTVVTATFDVSMNAATITTSSVELRTPANVLVPATVTYDGGTRTAILQPAAPLAASTVYTATVRGGATDPRVMSAAGSALAASLSWSFTTAAATTTCPCTIWNQLTAPVVPASSDAAAVEVGVKFKSDRNGYVSGIRFYKGPGNTGTHVGSLWTSGGTLLGSVTFGSETASGWQQADFTSPIAITASSTYIASYFTPAGRYAADSGALANAVDNGPLHTIANSSSANGVYVYTATAGTFPTQSYGSTSYWVDLVFKDVLGTDTAPPVITARQPVAGAIGASVVNPIKVAFNEPLDPSTVTTSAIELRTPANVVVAATVTYDATARVATLQPTLPLQPSTAYTVTVHGGGLDPRIKDAAANALVANDTWSFTTLAPPANDGPGGPILVIASTANPFGRYYGEILRNEGLNLFTVTDISFVTSSMLNAYDVIVLGEMPLTAAQVTMFTNWVTAGGNLIAMRPDKQLAGLLGLTDAAGNRTNQYLLMDTSGAAAGLVNQTIQYHGTADLYTLSGASAVATLYSSAATATSNPAVTLRSVGSNGGQAAAFTYDLARSVVYTRQGNPAWAGQERDGQLPALIRSDDLFFGAAAGDSQPDWVDFNKIAIPQADEQQRLLANLVLQMNVDRKPLPRLWYLPRGLKAAVIMSGDDHGNNGTAGRWDHFKAISPAGCSVDDWQCVRGTSYMYTSTPLSNALAASYAAEGFEPALHLSSNCLDYTPAAAETFAVNQLADWTAKYTGIGAPVTNRMHCIAWADYVTLPKVEANHGMRLDTTYYYWPAAWVLDRPGFFTGSGMPMRFADVDGTMIDVYQAASQMTDEANQTYPTTANTLLDRALGAEGYYGVFSANMHTDVATSTQSDAIIASAQARGVPIVTAKQMLTWLDGRNGSSFGSLAWNGATLTFTMVQAAGANGLQAMLPAQSATGALSALTVDGVNVAYTLQTIKGRSYAVFTTQAGAYAATYGAAPPPDTTITAAPASTTASTSASFSFTSSPSGATFQCKLDAAAFSVCTSPQAYASLAFGSHTFQVRAVNAVGTDASPASFTWTIASLPDTTITTSPIALTASTSANFSFTSNPSGATFECALDAAAFAVCTSPQAYASLALGSHTFQVRAVNAVGIDGSPASFTWTIASLPDTTITASPGALTASTSASFSFTSNPSGATFECALDAAAFAVCTSPQAYTSLAAGSHTYQVRAVNAVGTDGSPASFAWTITTLPDTSITASPAALTASTSANFSFSSTPGGATFECALDAASYSACTSPQAYSALSAGGHTFRVRAVNSVGTDPSPAVLNWTVTTSLWSAATVPAIVDDGDTDAVELGVKFQSDRAGYITGIRFYKAAANTGAHIGHLWTTSGASLGVATFSGESASGWQEASFPSPIAIAANTVYIASYFAPASHYSANSGYFANPYDNAPLHAPATGTTPNGVYRYSTTSVFPDLTYGATNYWVDVVFADNVTADTAPPTVASVTPATDATGVSPLAGITAVFSEDMAPASIGTATFELRDGSNAVVPASVSYNAAARTATLQPSAALSAGTTYTARLLGGAVEPTAEDLAGNPLASTASWSFTTSTSVPVTATPSSAVVQTGTLSSGTVTSLSTDDNTYYQVSSTTSGTRTATWYGSFTVPNDIVSLAVSYTGKNSQSSCTQVLEIYRWTDSTWAQLDSRTVGTTEVGVTSLTPTGVLADYVNGTAGNGELRVRVRTTRSGTTNFTNQGELMSITYMQ